MKVVALVSGGKDSCYNMQLCQSFGHEIVALANLRPLHDSVDELDSFMYQTVGHQVVAAFAECMGLPLFRRRIQGSPRSKSLRYSETEGDEVEDLEVLLRAVKSHFPGIGGVSIGAIASDYQRLRVENICSRLGLVSLAFMWKQEQASLLQNMIDSGLQAVLVKVAAMGFDPHRDLGKDLATLQPLFMKLQDLYGCNVCGEGGEYESLTLDCPLFKNAKIVLDKFTVELYSPDTIASVGVLHPVEFHLEYKSAAKDPDIIMADMLVEVTNNLVSTQYAKRDFFQGVPESSLNLTSSLRTQDACMESELLTQVNRQRHGFVAISCWRQVDELPLQEVQCELGALLAEIERNLQIENLCWADVLCVHLYLNNMVDFTRVNEIYVQHISEKESVRGVPSRCCVEVPLSQVRMGHVAVEILAVRDQSKKVLHVQSISSWAPSCIGPYSQATQHQQLMYMAGQLGLDPPTMNLVPGGAACEMTQALKNCLAVAGVFTPTFLKSVLSFMVYCSSAAGMKGMQDVEEVLEKFLSSGKELMISFQEKILPRPLVLYILLPRLPKGALVEVAPLTHVGGSSSENYDDLDQEDSAPSRQLVSMQSLERGLSGGHNGPVCQGLIIPGHLCRAFISVPPLAKGEANSFSMAVALDQAFHLLSNGLVQASLDWADVFVLRVYFLVEKISVGDLRKALEAVLDDYAVLNVPHPTLIPVMGVGETAQVQDLIAVELTASGGH